MQVASVLRQFEIHSESFKSQFVMHVKASSLHVSVQTWLSSKSLETNKTHLTDIKWYLRAILVHLFVRLLGEGQVEQNENNDSHFENLISQCVYFYLTNSCYFHID